MTNQERYRAILGNHLPEQAVEGVYSFLDRNKVHFHITRGRKSKLGDYRWPQRDHTFHEISVNGDLNRYQFLWVFLHEAAHLTTHLRYNETVSPHGHEWQGEYARLLNGMIDIFPADVQPLIVRYAKKIPLSHPLLQRIETQLEHYTPGYIEHEVLHLNDLKEGSHFILKNKPKMRFRAVERRRTRWLCHELTSGKDYLVSGNAEVMFNSENDTD